MSNLSVIRNSLNHEERIKMRIEAFRRDILDGDDSVEYVEDVLIAVQNYLCEYESDELQQATIKIREALYWVDAFNID